MLARPALYAYEEACAAHSRQVPERYNIAADVCDKHPRDKLAMIHEDPEGAVREIDWGQLQDMSDRFAALRTDHGVRRGDRVAVLAPSTPGRRRCSWARGRPARSCCRCRSSTATTPSGTTSTTTSSSKTNCSEATHASRRSSTRTKYRVGLRRRLPGSVRPDVGNRSFAGAGHCSGNHIPGSAGSILVTQSFPENARAIRIVEKLDDGILQRFPVPHAYQHATATVG
jgi:hypothetical protein